MAKWGEGDPRWIVEDRPDATNVNNWHWKEKNATPWSKNRLNELLCGQKISKGPFIICIGDFKKINGEATANNRKAKLIFFFEWDIELDFKVRIAGSEVELEGRIEIPNLSDENEAIEVDVSPTLISPSIRESEIQHILRNDVVIFIRKQLATYISDLKERFSEGLILPTDRIIQSHGKTIVKSVVDKKSFQSCVVSSEKDTTSTASIVDKSSLKSLSFYHTFKVNPDLLWKVLTDPTLIKKWTNSIVEMDYRVNGSYLLFNGAVNGIFMKIEENKELKSKWRLKSYPQNHYAELSFKLNDQGDCTNLMIDIVGIPSNLYDITESGFRNFYISNIGRTFGFDAHIL